jgi:predicted transcriptional regulator
MESVTNMVNVESNSKLDMSPDGDFFRVWVEFLRPIHNLPSRQMDVLAAFLKKRYELGKVISDPKILKNTLMSDPVKKEIMAKYNITYTHFRVIMYKLRKNGVIRDNDIYLNLIPSLTEDGAGLMVYFNFKKHAQRIKLGGPPGI